MKAKVPVKKSVKDQLTESVGQSAAADPEKKVKKAESSSVGTRPPAKRTKKKATPVDPFAQVAGSAPVKSRKTSKSKPKTTAPVIAMAETDLSPESKALANVSLPALKRENRARLQMQTPTRLYFYWSIKDNPWSMLSKAFGGETGSYTLVLKLTDAKRDTEVIHRVEREGNFWFHVEPNGEYQAEIGFYAPNRPYFRVIHSNTITTPRRSPSPRPASEARWTVSANKFAEVLDVAGFSRDAFDVALAGDDPVVSSSVTHTAFTSMIGVSPIGLDAISDEDIRYAMIALAAGSVMEDLRGRVSPALFGVLQTNSAGINAPRAKAALTEHFDIDEAEFEQEEFGSAVFGSSLVNFPKTLKTKKLSPKYAPRYNPVSSPSIGF